MGTSKKKFKDTDLEKTASLDEMFWGVLESFDGQSSSTPPLPEAVETPIQESPAQSSNVEDVLANMWNEPAPLDTPAEPTEPVAPATPEEPAEPIADATEENEAESNEELIREFEKILFETKDIAEAAESVKEATAAWESWAPEVEMLMLQIQQFQAKEQAYKDAMDKALQEIGSYESERALTELDVSKKNKIYELVMGDDSLKTLLALKKQADENPDKETDFKEFLNEFYEKHSGNKISDMVNKVNKSEKMALGWAESWAVNSSWGMSWLNGVLEDL